MWRDLTNDQLRNKIGNIVNNSNSAEEVNRKACELLQYPYHIAVAYSKPNRAGQRMSMFSAFAKDGQVLS